MRAVNLYGPDEFSIDEIEKPTPGARDVVIKVGACGICGTDLGFVRSGGFGRKPMPLGHESAGIVAEVGPALRDLKVGMRVAINPMGEQTNIIGNGGSEGAFADYLLIRNAELDRNLIALPDELPLEIAALAEPLGVSLHAVNRADPSSGDKVVVFGVGPIGLGAVIWLRERGIDDIVAVDLSTERLKLAKEFGARSVVLAGSDDLEGKLVELHGRENVGGMSTVGTDIYIDAAGAPQIIRDVVNLSKWHAKLIVVAAYRAEVPISLGTMLRKELLITTSMGYPEELPGVVARLARDPEYFRSYISHTFEFENFREAMQVAARQSASKVMIRFSE